MPFCQYKTHKADIFSALQKIQVYLYIVYYQLFVKKI